MPRDLRHLRPAQPAQESPAQQAPATAPAARHLEVQDLCVSFPVGRSFFRTGVQRHVRAVQNVSFSVPRGSCYAIVGESGSGKSTLARALVGLVRMTSGEVIVDGTRLSGLTARDRRRLRRRVQLVLQDPRASIDPRMRVREVLREALVVHDITRDRADQRARIERVIRQVGLSPAHLDRYANELSGGQRQRVAIARAIILEPEILVLDEPVSALDVSIQAQIVNLLVELQDRLGLTYVIITHDLALVSHFADDTGVMYLGRFVEQGPARDVCMSPRHPYSESLLSVVASDDPEFERGREVALLEGSIPSPLALPSGCVFHTRCPQARRVAPGLPAAARVAQGGHELPRRCVEDLPLASHDGGRGCACHFPLGAAPASDH
ncbi:oligopeptide/dipeptide ABC transporter ATP-binding protein [Salipiger marinus]|uniref:oligopeptide/dipeptide ABC transporter ATP-binding protein n=1 Tax=Salipiger marinus TaxID=555512 RepID=UPI001E51F2A3|nr:ABC transporter ATP-binding protein [Salipiger manganoxidans]MCD1618001.1 ABC transporter ATP-binding protein [Salipiger manganoxidans]MEB3418677.1 ABC transporter ATP-binding protein [Salipiger manganoxidans]